MEKSQERRNGDEEEALAKDNKALMVIFHSIKLQERRPKLGELKKGQEIAVACEDAWYFGE